MKLKNINFGLGLVALLALSSCADDKFSEYRTDMTKNLKEYQYLNNYEPLKKYVEDMKASGKCNPDFKLGIALAAPDFNKQELVYCLAGSNFNEMTAGNAMKYASCVKNDGTFDFNTVKDFVTNAKDAGLTIYGHTLAWHSQQNKTYLSKLIADKEIPVDPSQKVEKTDYQRDCSTLTKYDWSGSPESVKTEWNKDGAVVITNPEPIADWWTLQYWLVNGISLNPGTTYKITILCKAEGEGKSPAHIRFKIGNWDDSFELPNGFEIPVGGNYKEVSFEVTPKIGSNGLFFQHGDFAGKIYWKSIKITHSEAPSIEIFTDCISNGEMKTGDDMSNFVVREAGKGGDVAGTPIAGGPDGKNCVVVHANANAANEWDTQFFIYTPNKTWSAGDKYKITFYYKASENIDAVTQCHSKPGDYLHYECLSPNPSFTTQWQKYESTGKIPEQGDGMKAIAFNLNVGKKDHAIDYYFADIHWYTVEKGNKIPLKPEEKKSLLTDAMGKWIDGMMEATDGYVTSWDVVNEAISGVDKDGDGFYDLQSATRGTVSSDDAKNNFYWQDYLDDIDYVRTAVRDARKSFAKHNGDPSKLKLFINDYNLEGYWDKQHDKLKSLIHWIGLWEDPNAKEPVVIDGIGTQMHVTCYGDETKQAKLKSDIEEMFKLLAKTGKLVKISELDMAYEDEAGTSVTFDKMTEEQHKQMRSFYTFIIQKYFELIPQAQQYGITQWCATDSPKDSGWRAGCPTGLWDSNYLRKHTYAGFAVGLGAQEYWKEAK
ncbi:endo-1,4-beta-xylanase [Segatella sp.]|uniref:endo-1,4-beta-xylanase n=1 Tax=Segatella sp. TaxID=2974253 RepID=UPI0030807869